MVDWDHEGARWFLVIVYSVVMIPVYFYVLQPILVDFSPIFAYEGSVRAGPRSIGELMFFVFLIGVFTILASIKFILSNGLDTYLKGVTRFPIAIILIAIPDKYLPEKYVIDDSNLDE